MILALFLIAGWSIIYSTLTLGISPMPSHRSARSYLLQNIPKGFCGTFVDIGSGWGGVTRAVAKKFPDATVVGIERSLIPYLFSRLIWGRSCSFFYKDFRKEIPSGDIYYTYLFPGGMESVKKLLPKNGILISNAFALPGVRPCHREILGRWYQTPIYTYSWILEKSSNASNRENTF